jgi:hypothetical protein
VELLAGWRFPELIDAQHDEHQRLASSYVLPDEALPEVPDELQGASSPKTQNEGGRGRTK